MIIIVAIIAIILAILLNMQKNNTTNKESNIIEQEQIVEDIKKVTVRNDFYTVVSCIDKYLNYLATKDVQILYNYLDENYIKENQITTQNILSKIKTLEEHVKFRPEEMYVKKISDNVEQYYVFGHISKEVTEGEPEEIAFYISIKLDKVNNTFSVIPDLYITK